jgi:hypothetical protein
LKQAVDNELLVRYLLGELSEEEAERVERRYISEPEVYDQLLTVEDDLIDFYVEGALAESRRASFEGHFLRSPERQSRVMFAEAWLAYVARQPKATRKTAPVPEPPRFAFFRFETWPMGLRLAAAMVVLLAIVFPIVQTLRLRNQLEVATSQREELERNQQGLQAQIEDERRRAQELSSLLDRELSARDPKMDAPDSTDARVISFLLTAGQIRGTGESRRLILPADVSLVRLQLSLESSGHDSYFVNIKTVGGRSVWSGRARQRGSGSIVSVQIPATALKTEDYVIVLSGVKGSNPSEVISEYSLGVTRR